jgi:phosphoribosyl-AMP cyclohydrolase
MPRQRGSDARHHERSGAQLTIETGIAHYWSRSRRQLWKKGETSGNLQMVDEIRVDCDQDAVLLKVRVSGADATCHTGRRSCFYRKVDLTKTGNPAGHRWQRRCLTPDTVYRKK